MINELVGATAFYNVGVFDTSGNWIPGINGAMTDASGNYTLAGIPAGSYKLYFNGQSAGYVSQWYNGVANQSLATTLGVTAGNTYTGYDAQLSQGGSISGRVTNSGAAGIQNVSVQVRDTSGNGIPNINGTSTDGSGNYTLGGLPTGDYKIYFDGSQNGYISQWFNNAPDQSSATILHVLAGGTLPNTNAVLTQGSTIAGTVTTNGVTGIQNISVQLYNSTGTQTLSNTNTDASGGYQFNGLQAGTYKVCFTPGQTNYIAQCYNNLANDPANATGILLTVPGGNGGVNATMTLGGGISGQVTNGSSGIQNISVEVRDTTNGNPIPGVISMWTDASGNYTVRGIPAGGNVKVYFNPNATSYAGQWYNNKTSSANADLVPISAGVTTSPVSALLVPATVPGAPTINSITPGYNNATVNFTAPASDGGRTINNYTVTANPGGFNNSNSGSPITVFGLTTGLQYTISVTAQNNLGSGPAASTLYSLPLPVNNGDDLQTAVNAIAPDGAIWAQAGTSNLTFPPLLITKCVTISGGYSPDYSTVS